MTVTGAASFLHISYSICRLVHFTDDVIKTKMNRVTLLPSISSIYQ